MTEHRRWEGIDALPDKHALDIQMAYVQGYILALEDVFKDLAVTMFPTPEHAESGDEQHIRVFLFRRYRKDVRRKLSESYDSARRTLKLFKEAYERKPE